MEGSLLKVKLKPKLTYKGYYEYHFVDVLHVRLALEYLKSNSVLYNDIQYNEERVNEFCRQEEATSSSEDKVVEKVEACLDEQVGKESKVTGQGSCDVEESSDKMKCYMTGNSTACFRTLVLCLLLLVRKH